MSRELIVKVDSFVNNITNASFETEFAFAKSLIRKYYKAELDRFKIIISDALNRNWDVIITVDSDFDGYSSARALYHFIRLLGVPQNKIRFVPLNGLHTTDKPIDANNSLVLISDTGYGNVKISSNNHKLIWIDHHGISGLELMKARSSIGSRGVFVNTSRSTEEYIQGLSCGAFLYIFLSEVIEQLGLTSENEQYMIKNFDDLCRQESLLSLISDVMKIENYSGLIKGIYDSKKTPLYEMLKSNFDYNNKSYFKKHIAKINNLIRMDRFDILERILTDEITHDMLMEIERVEDDKRIIINRYLSAQSPRFSSICDNKVVVAFYELPLSNNKVMRNFKGFMASINTPNEGVYIIFSYYKSNGQIFLSCRNNINIDVKEYIANNNVPVVTMGGHQSSFGVVLKEEDFELFRDVMGELPKKVEISKLNVLGTFINYYNLEPEFKTLSNLAVFNEFYSDEVRIVFDKSDFFNVVEEPRRTLYELELKGNKKVGVVSFAVNTIKDRIIAKPQLKKSLYDLDCIDIGEFK